MNGAATMALAFLATAALAIIPLFFGWILYKGLRHGVMPVRGVSYSRAKQPILFWLSAAVYGSFVAFMVLADLRFLQITMAHL